MKNYSAPEFKLILIEAENVLTTSMDKAHFVDDPFGPLTPGGGGGDDPVLPDDEF